MATIEEMLSNIEVNRIANEQLKKELEDLNIENEILKSEKKDMMVEIIGLEFKIKKFGAKPKSSKIRESNKVMPMTEEELEESDKKMKVKIEYEVPQEYHMEEDIVVDIVGNFTEWVPQAMQRDPEKEFVYSFTGLLDRGFKHRYQFLVNGDEHIDHTKKSSVNFTGSKTNFIMVPLKSLEQMHAGDISSFMCQDSDSPSLLNYPSFVPAEIAKVVSQDPDINGEEGNKTLHEYVTSKMSECEDIAEKKKFLQTKILESEEEKDKVVLRQQFKELDNEYCKTGLALKKALQGRIVHTHGIDPTIYEVTEYISSENSIRVRRIYDQNKILLEENNYNNKVTYKKDQVLDTLQFLTIDQETSVRMEMLKDYHTFKINYQVDRSTGENECLPMSVEPSFISLSDYHIDFDKLNGVIKTITNRMHGPIKYVAKEMDLNAGFVSNSVFEVWTNEVSAEVYNIIHCHINDMSDSVPIATEYLKEGDEVKDFMKFETDSAGQVLRYKILIKNQSILTVLYNSGASIEEIPFKEVKFSLDEPLLQAKVGDFGDEPIIVKLNKIPKSMMCAHNKKLLEHEGIETVENEPMTHCKMRYFERLPGYIDVEMVSSDNCVSLHEGEYKFSLPACICEPLDDYQKTMVISMQEFQKEESKKGASQAVETMFKLVEEYKEKAPKTLEEMKACFQDLKAAEEEINLKLGDEVEDEALIARAKEVTDISSKILRGLAAEMRFMAMKLPK